MRTSSWLLVLAGLALPAQALAQLPPSKTGRAGVGAFKSLDRDGDHGLSLAELRARGREKGSDSLFVLLDGDGDNRLSLKEFTPTGNGALPVRFDAYDVNKDGFVIRREFPNFVDPLLFIALDRDRDGRVALGEIRPAFAGSRVVPTAAPEPRKAAKAQPPAPTWCWVPAFGNNGDGDGRWGLEAPVVWGRCHTTGW